MKYLDKLTDLFQLAGQLVYRYDRIDEKLTYITNKLGQVPSEPKPFVLILVNGFKVKEREVKPPFISEETKEALDARERAGFPGQDYGFSSYHGSREDYITEEPVTMAVSGYAPHIFQFQPDIKIGNIQVGIICDVQRVRIDQILAANQHLSPTTEAGPFSYCKGIIGPWNRITVATSLR